MIFAGKLGEIGRHEFFDELIKPAYGRDLQTISAGDDDDLAADAGVVCGFDFADGECGVKLGFYEGGLG